MVISQIYFDNQRKTGEKVKSCVKVWPKQAISLLSGYHIKQNETVTLDCIYEVIKAGEFLETEKEFFLAYKVYLDAENAYEDEQEAWCSIGLGFDFACMEKELIKAEENARRHRYRVWWKLTEEEKVIANDKSINLNKLLFEWSEKK